MKIWEIIGVFLIAATVVLFYDAVQTIIAYNQTAAFMEQAFGSDSLLSFSEAMRNRVIIDILAGVFTCGSGLATATMKTTK